MSGDPFGTQDSEQIEIDGGHDDPLFIVGRRLDTQHGSARVGFDQQLSPRWSVNLSASYAESLSDEIEGDESFDDVEDRDDLGGGVGLSRTLSAGYVARPDYTVRPRARITGQSLTHSLGVGVNRRLGERLSVSFQIGAYYRDQVAETVNGDDREDEWVPRKATWVFTEGLV